MKRQPRDNLSITFQNKEDRTNKENGTGDNRKQKYYGIETGNRFIKRFKLLFRNGKEVSIPYAFLPIFTLTSDQQIQIATHDIEIKVNGRGLHKICDYLNEEKILWIKESNTKIDDEELDVYVSDISISGEWLS